MNATVKKKRFMASHGACPAVWLTSHTRRSDRGALSGPDLVLCRLPRLGRQPMFGSRASEPAK